MGRSRGKCANVAQNIYKGCRGHLQRLSGYIQRLPRILAKVASDKGKGYWGNGQRLPGIYAMHWPCLGLGGVAAGE